MLNDGAFVVKTNQVTWDDLPDNWQFQLHQGARITSFKTEAGINLVLDGMVIILECSF
jgi:hypothetical protein